MPDEPETPTQNRAKVVRRRWWLIALVTLLLLGIGLLFSLQRTPVYQAQALLLLDSAQVATGDAGSAVQSEEVATQQMVVESRPVAQLVAKALGSTESPDNLLNSLTVAPVGATRVLRITVANSSPTEAAKIANSFASSYLAYQKTQTAPATGTSSSAKGTSSSVGEILVPAVTNRTPSDPKPAVTAVLCALLGLLLGLTLAFVVERFDDGIRDEEALHAALGSVPVLGSIPRSRDIGHGLLATVTEPFSPAAEAYRALGTSIRFLLAVNDRDQSHQARGRSLLVTSAGPKEGKSLVAANLAVAAARTGMTVALVDGDLREPRQAVLFSVQPAAGLSDVLVGTTAIRDALATTGIEGLVVLPAGTIPPNPAELLASDSMRGLVLELTTRFDLVIFDSSPVLGVADTLELAPLADSSLLVTRPGLARKRTVQAALQRIQRVGGTISGGVLNDSVNNQLRRSTPSRGGTGSASARQAEPQLAISRDQDGGSRHAEAQE